MKSLTRLLQGMRGDYLALLPGVKGLDRDFVTIEKRLEHEGDSFLTVTLPAFCKWFDRSLADQQAGHIEGFSLSGPLPKFLSGLVSSVFDAKTGRILKDPSIECIRCIREICLFFKKYRPSDERNDLLSRQAIDRFVCDDEAVKPLTVDDTAFITRMCHLILPNLDGFWEEDGKHGPGAVEEGYGSNQKWSELYKGLCDYDPRLMDLGYDMLAVSQCEVLPIESPPSIPIPRPARLVTVPKSSTALRTITVEGCISQFSQQAYNRILRDQIRKCSVLSQCLSLNSQEPNQLLALEGSRTGTWQTIDLSSASDLLSQQLVEAVFRYRPRFLHGLLSTRTPEVQISKEEKLTLKKYAGMGNATTFPVQSVVFATIAIATILIGERITLRACQRASRYVRVFGDDIIIHKDYYQAVIDRITSLGLKINRDKTFATGNFRESCGVDAFMGVDVTPVYIRCNPDDASQDPSSFESILGTCNQLWMRCLYRTSNVLRDSLERKFKLPLVRRASEGLGLHTRLDAYNFSRWSCKFHRFEVKAPVSTPVRSKDVLDGNAALVKFFHSGRVTMIHGEAPMSEKDHLVYVTRRFRNKLRVRWVHA